MRRAAALPILAAVLGAAGCGGGSTSPTTPPTVVQYRLSGLAFSPYLDLDPNQGATVPADRVARLLDGIAPYCVWIRTYGATHGLENVPRLARSRGLRVAAGCWLSRDAAANAAEVGSLIKLIQAGEVDLAIVGTEVLLRGDLSEAELIGYIRQVKAAGVPTTTNDSWYELLTHPSLLAECDVVLANFYPYWEGVPVQEAVRSVHSSYRRLRDAAGKEVIVGETGWPSGGEAVGAAEASPENAASYFLNFVSWARAENVRYFYFEAFDETWKAR